MRGLGIHFSKDKQGDPAHGVEPDEIEWHHEHIVSLAPTAPEGTWRYHVYQEYLD